jgi:hypothetical protein
LDAPHLWLLDGRGKSFQFCFPSYLKISPLWRSNNVTFVENVMSVTCIHTTQRKMPLGRLRYMNNKYAYYWQGCQLKWRCIRELTETLPSLSVALYYINRTGPQSICLASYSTTSTLSSTTSSERLHRGRDHGAIQNVRPYISLILFCQLFLVVLKDLDVTVFPA